MPGKQLFHSAYFLILLLFSSACQLTAPRPTIDPNLIYTAGAETIVARLTEIPATAVLVTITGAAPATETPSPPTLTPSPATSPTAPLAPSATPTSTATESIPPTAPADDPRDLLGAPDWEDNFENGNNWPMVDDDHAEMRVRDGELRMLARNTDMWDSWMIAMPQLEDFYLEMTARTGQCEAKDHYGLLFRAPDSDAGYLLSFSCDGQYSLRIWDGEEFTDLVDWTASEFIQNGSNQANRLGVMAEGERLALYANGNLLTTVNDDTFSEGSFGPLIGADATEDFRTFVSQVAYWVIR